MPRTGVASGVKTSQFITERVIADSQMMCTLVHHLDRTPASEHLPLAWTHSTDEEESLLMTRLEELREQYLTPAEQQPAQSGRQQK